jgi:hypothetical protein
MPVAAWSTLLYCLSTTGIGISDFRFWGILAMITVIELLARRQGRTQGIFTVMDMSLSDYQRYKAAWTRAAQDQDPPQP